MLEDLLPRKFKEIQSLPFLGSLLDEFDDWLAGQGYTDRTRDAYIRMSREIDAYFQECLAERVDDLTLQDWDTCRKVFRDRAPNTATVVSRLRAFVKEKGKLRLSVVEPRDDELTRWTRRYTEHLAELRGLEPTTVKEHAFTVRRFLGHLATVHGRLNVAEVEARDLESFIVESATIRSRETMQHVVGHLRGFLRFVELFCQIPHGLCDQIDTPIVYRMERLPRALSWDVVQELLDSIDKGQPIGLRNYTMFFLMAHYGFRCCDIARLSLDDIHWRRRRIVLSQRKTKNTLVLPLTDWAAMALYEYLHSGGRPVSAYRHLFLGVRAPCRPLKPTAVTEAFRNLLRRSDIGLRPQGPHCLRHSYAVHLLRRGASLKAISDLLGHRALESTCVYLRLAVEDLREVALSVPAKTEVD